MALGRLADALVGQPGLGDGDQRHSFRLHGTAFPRAGGRWSSGRLHQRDGLAARIGATVRLLIAALQPVGGVVFVLDGILMGAGDFRFLFASTAVAALAGLAPLAVLAVVADWGLLGVWTRMVALMAIRLAATVARVRGGRWLSSSGRTGGSVPRGTRPRPAAR